MSIQIPYVNGLFFFFCSQVQDSAKAAFGGRGVVVLNVGGSIWREKKENLKTEAPIVTRASFMRWSLSPLLTCNIRALSVIKSEKLNFLCLAEAVQIFL